MVRLVAAAAENCYRQLGLQQLLLLPNLLLLRLLLPNLMLQLLYQHGVDPQLVLVVGYSLRLLGFHGPRFNSLEQQV